MATAVREAGIRHLTPSQRERVERAVLDARAYVAQHGPVPCDAPNIWGKPVALRYDAISLAVETHNEWWRGLTGRQIAVVTRLIHRILRRGR